MNLFNMNLLKLYLLYNEFILQKNKTMNLLYMNLLLVNLLYSPRNITNQKRIK